MSEAVRVDALAQHLVEPSSRFRPIPVTPVRLHDVRHTHASLLLRDRVPIKVVSERLGHSTQAFTMATYQHVLPGMQDDAAWAFAAILAAHTVGQHPVAAGRSPVERVSGAQ